VLTGWLRRWGLWPVVAAVTLASMLLSLAIVVAVHAALGIALGVVSVTLALLCPLLLAPTMSAHSFGLLLELDAAHSQLRRLSDTDDLTGAFNRRYFMAALRAEAERAARNGPAYCVALIDVDDFKGVNDRHGHFAGDEVLRTLARACGAQVRSTDVFARFGGEEFAVLLPMTDLAHAACWLERLRERVAALRLEEFGDRVAVTVSIGVAGVDGTLAPAVQVEHALRAADEALYRAKREGKNRVELSAAPALAFGAA
jgi:diguanylate cyclase (GGDEF)-like protein